MDKNKVIIDWLSFTSHIDSTESVIDMLGMYGCTFQNIKGAKGYKDRLYFDNISLHYNGREDMGIWCEMSGQGCRNFETYGSGDYDSIFDNIHENSNEMNITRLDIAYDDFDGLLEMDRLIKDVVAQNYVSPTRHWNVQVGSKGSSIVIGSMKSDILIRIYDKAMERGMTDGTHWIRCEIQLRRERAEQFAFNSCSIGEKYVGVLNNYLRFIDSETDNRKDRCTTADYWLAFLESAEKLTLYEKPGAEYNELSLENYVLHQAGNSIYTYIECFGKDKFFKDLKKCGSRLNQKQQALIDKYKGGVIYD